MLFGTIRDFGTFANEFSKDSSPRPEGSFGTAVPTDGSCNGNRLPGRTFGDNPSYADERVMSGSPWPQYIIDENHVHRLDPNHQAGDPLNSPVDRNPNCS